LCHKRLLSSGSLRQNLDALQECSNAKVLGALEKCGLSEFVEKLEGGLDALVADGGRNFSAGEKQMLCLARALVRNTGVLVLDEATANVDPENDAKVQNTIRKAFNACTILTIAHRLHTIMDSSRIMVLDSGQLVEFDAPKCLLENHGGLFFGMAKEAGLVEEEQASHYWSSSSEDGSHEGTPSPLMASL